jgi:hypothetical protein
MKLHSSTIARAAMAAAVLSQAHAAVDRHMARHEGRRVRTLDHSTFDAASFAGGPINAFGDQRGMVLEHQYRTHDSASRPIVDGSSTRARTVDSTGAFLIGELERLDPTLHMPLAAVTWSRDIDLREDVTLADEFSSFTLTTFGSAGGLGAGNGDASGKGRNGKAWAGKATDQIGGVSVDTGKVPNPLTPWALEIKFSILELESAIKMGRPIDDQKLQALKLKCEMDTDEQVYVGDATLNVGGLINSPLVTNVANVVNGAAASPLWVNKTPDEVLKDVNEVLQSGWAASGFTTMPRKVLIPPVQFGALSTKVISSAGTTSILKYLRENNIVAASGNGSIDIQPAKWATGFGAGATDRLVAYTQRKDFVRFPKTALQRTPIQYDSLYHKSTYYCRLGVVEVVYPETIAYRDGL